MTTLECTNCEMQYLEKLLPPKLFLSRVENPSKRPLDF